MPETKRWPGRHSVRLNHLPFVLEPSQSFLTKIPYGQVSLMSAFPSRLSRDTKHCPLFCSIKKYPAIVVSSKAIPRRCVSGNCSGMCRNDLKACRIPSADQMRLQYLKTTLLGRVNERLTESTSARERCMFAAAKHAREPP